MNNVTMAGKMMTLNGSVKKKRMGNDFEYTPICTSQQNNNVGKKFATLFNRVLTMLNCQIFLLSRETA